MSTTTTYPNGQQLVSTALTVPQIDAILQNLTQGMLGQTPSVSSSLVRVSWPTQGAPFQNAADDICYLRCVPRMDPYDLIRDRACIPVAESSPPVVTERWTYTRSWDIHWTLYGPNSTDNARAIKSALFMDYFTDALAGSQLFPVPDFPEPMRVPELIDAQWFDRSDFSIIAYEFVIETIIDQTVASVEVILNTEEGVAADFTVTA